MYVSNAFSIPFMVTTTRHWWESRGILKSSSFLPAVVTMEFGFGKNPALFEVMKVAAPSKGCQLNPKGWWIDTL